MPLATSAAKVGCLQNEITNVRLIARNAAAQPSFIVLAACNAKQDAEQGIIANQRQVLRLVVNSDEILMLAR